MSRHERSVSTGSQPTAHRYSASHANSSAFSASANANEDWTKVSDLAERRRIQNRIAQRNYRKKLKRRLEDLERRAASASASPEPEPRMDGYGIDHKSRISPGLAPTSSARYADSPEPQFSQRIPDRETFMPLPDDRHIMSRSPPTFSYSSFGTQDNLTAPYPHSPALSYSSVPSPGLPGDNFGSYLNPRISLGSSASSPHDTSNMKQEYFGQDFSTYGYSYSSIGSYPDSNHAYTATHTPELSDVDPFESFDPSMSGSPADIWSLYSEPMPESPPFLQL